MSTSLYLVVLRGCIGEGASGDVQRQVKAMGGYVLMATSRGPVIALEDALVASLLRHPAVELVGGVTFNPRGLAFEQLQRVCAENLALQLEPLPQPPDNPRHKEAQTWESDKTC